MGNLLCCIKDNKYENDHLLGYMYCDKCMNSFLSPYEYNRHIYKCNQDYSINNNIDNIYGE